MVEEKEVKELEKMPLHERLKRLKELEELKQKELEEIKHLIEKDIHKSLDEEKIESAPQQDAKAEEEEDEKTSALEDVVKAENAEAPATIEYGRPIAKVKIDIGTLYEEVKRFRDEMTGVLNQGYRLNPHEEGELYQLKKMVEQAEIAQSYVKAPKVHTELLNIAEQILESMQNYRIKRPQEVLM